MSTTCELHITRSVYGTSNAVVPGTNCGSTLCMSFCICSCSGVDRMKFNRRQSLASVESKLGDLTADTQRIYRQSLVLGKLLLKSNVLQ